MSRAISGYWTASNFNTKISHLLNTPAAAIFLLAFYESIDEIMTDS